MIKAFLLALCLTNYSLAHQSFIKTYEGIKRELREDEWQLGLEKIKNNKKLNKLPENLQYLDAYKGLLSNQVFFMVSWLNLEFGYEYLFLIVKDNEKYIKVYMKNGEILAGEYF